MMSDAPRIEFVVELDAWNSIPGLEELVSAAAGAALDAADFPAVDAELTVMLGDDSRLAELNERWRGKSGATNVLSFPHGNTMPLRGERSRYLGDIALAFGVVAGEAAAQRKSVNSHLSHLVVHGILHLIGYDHDDEESACRMESLERAAMQTLGFEDPYAEQSAA